MSLYCELVLVAHLGDVVLCVAATILNCLDNCRIAFLRCVDYALCRETYLAANVVNSGANSAHALLQLVEVTIKVRAQCGQGIVITSYRLHQQVGVVVVSHLRAQRLDLALYLGILQTIAVVAEPEAIATEHGKENKIQKRIVKPLVSTSKATIHHGCQGHRVIALVVRHCRISKRIITSVATDYFLYIVHNYECIKSVGEYPPIPQRW